MKTKDILGIVGGLLLIFIVVLILAVNMNDVVQKGIEVKYSDCLSVEEGYRFCNSIFLKNMSHVTVYKDDKYDGNMLILMFNTAEMHGYSITSGGYSIYIEPTPN